MRKRVFHKTILREIRQSFGRFAAIAAIIALGAGFFTGLKITNTDMIETAEVYLNRTAFFDYRLISTQGWDAEAVARLSSEPGVSAAEGTVTADVLADIGGRETVVSMMAITERINKPELVSGRMPENDAECLADSYNLSGLSLGTTVTVTEGNDPDTLDLFRTKTFTVVGFARTPLYMNFERGTTTVGSGSLSGFILVPPGAFDDEVYTELVLTLEDPGYVYSDAYKASVDGSEDRITAAAEAAADARYGSLLADAEEELTDGAKEYSDGVKEYADGRQEYLDGVKEYLEGVRDYADGLVKYADGLKEYEDGRQEYEDGLKEYEDGAEQYKWTRINTNHRLNSSESELDSKEKELKAVRSGLAAQRKALEADPVGNAAAIAYIDKQIAQCDGGLAQIAAGRKELKSARSKAKAGFKKAEDELADAETELADAKQELADAEQELADAKQELTDAETKLADARTELDDALKELTDGRADVLSGRDELVRGRQKILSIRIPEVYVLTREENVGYVCFENDAGIVSGIAKVFPLFFFAVAALVCVTTTGRMVDEQRGQIGIFKALGYGRFRITQRYLFYTGSASLIGVLVGVIGGSLLFPPVIWTAYSIMYILPKIELLFDRQLMLMAGGSYLVLALFVTWFSCRRELNEPAAELLRPRSPSPGKRILLERVGFIWKRLKFLRKVSLRNVFRYRKRLVMMVLGIGGCTALLLTGLGLNDSITHLADRQYGEISLYDALVSFTEDMSGDERRFLSRCGADVERFAFMYSTSAACKTSASSGSVNLIGVEDYASLDGLMDFHTRSGEAVRQPGAGECVISRNMADKYGLAAGDAVTLTVNDTETVTLRVAGVFENIIYHYVYTPLESLRPYIGELPLKSAYLGFREGADPHLTGSSVANVDDVAAVQLTADMLDRVNSMLDSMKYVVALVIACAGALSFIVLVNLTNINIQERVREIATLRVLGFYTGESARYIFRENNLLTLCGCAAGVPMGIWLHDYVMAQIKIDMMSFDAVRQPLSYALAIGITFVFTWLVDAFMRPRIAGIKMAESLKSIE